MGINNEKEGEGLELRGCGGNLIFIEI